MLVIKKHKTDNNNKVNTYKSLFPKKRISQGDKVSIIIPTYNRYKSVLIAIESVKNQTYKNIEIIVVNDASTQKEYYKTNAFNNTIKVIHLPINMRIKYKCDVAQGYTRNEGINVATGKYIAFLDDDDYWFPEKLEYQIGLMKKYNYKMCSTNFMKGAGTFNYKRYMSRKKYLENNSKYLKYIGNNSFELIYPEFHYTLTSSVIMEKTLIVSIGLFKLGTSEDWDLWRKAYKVVKILFVDIPLLYYDKTHAKKQHYGKQKI